MNNTQAIAQLGNPVLRKRAQAVTNFDDPVILQLVEDMQNNMLASNGVGIAAPQLSASWQLLIIASRPTPRYPNAPEMMPLTMFNPKFEAIGAEKIKDWEGCLSIPGIRALVPRHLSIRVRYQDNRGQARQIDLSGFPARVFQHEFDHLLGLVYLDRVEDNRDIISDSEFLKLIHTEDAAA